MKIITLLVLLYVTVTAAEPVQWQWITGVYWDKGNDRYIVQGPPGPGYPPGLEMLREVRILDGVKAVYQFNIDHVLNIDAKGGSEVAEITIMKVINGDEKMLGQKLLVTLPYTGPKEAANGTSPPPPNQYEKGAQYYIFSPSLNIDKAMCVGLGRA